MRKDDEAKRNAAKLVKRRYFLQLYCHVVIFQLSSACQCHAIPHPPPSRSASSKKSLSKSQQFLGVNARPVRLAYLSSSGVELHRKRLLLVQEFAQFSMQMSHKIPSATVSDIIKIFTISRFGDPDPDPTPDPTSFFIDFILDKHLRNG